MNTKRKKILVIGGGGCFGIIPIVFLRSVLFNNINDIDAIAGTSIGGIIAIYLALGGSADDLYTDFKLNVSKIFKSPSFWRRFCANSSKYPAGQIEEVLKNILPKKFGDIKIKILIPSLDYKTNKPKIFDNIIRDEDCDLYNWQIGRATSAAPTYFPPYTTDGYNILLDGGLIENIPIETTVFSLKKILGWEFNEMDVFAIGTGNKYNDNKILDDVNNYNYIDWLKNLLLSNCTTLNNEIITDFRSRLLEFNSYMYFNPVNLDNDWNMDNYKLIDDNSVEDRCQQYLNDFKLCWDKFISNEQKGIRSISKLSKYINK